MTQTMGFKNVYMSYDWWWCFFGYLPEKKYTLLLEINLQRFIEFVKWSTHNFLINLVLNLDWISTAFDNLRIRMGGSLQDQILYQIGYAIHDCPQIKKVEGGLFGFSEGCLTVQKWDEVNKLINQTGYVHISTYKYKSKSYDHHYFFLMTSRKFDELVKNCRALFTFGLNALIGKNKPEPAPKGDNITWTGDWDSQNARDLIEYTLSKGYKIDSYELGNLYYTFTSILYFDSEYVWYYFHF